MNCSPVSARLCLAPSVLTGLTCLDSCDKVEPNAVNLRLTILGTPRPDFNFTVSLRTRRVKQSGIYFKITGLLQASPSLVTTAII